MWIEKLLNRTFTENDRFEVAFLQGGMTIDFLFYVKKCFKILILLIIVVHLNNPMNDFRNDKERNEINSLYTE